jgi:cytidylate kinase
MKRESDNWRNVILAGPCGVGKSAVSELLTHKMGMRYLDFDTIRSSKNYPLCSLSKLNIIECLSSELNCNTRRFVLDIGGDTLFRKNADNNERIAQVMCLRETYAAVVIVLTANKDALQRRFVSTKNRTENEFDEIWRNWKDIAEPYWKKCGDIFIDTSFLTINETIGKIKTTLKDNVNQYE